MRSIYRIRAILDTKEDVIRDFEIEANSSLNDLHIFIFKSFGFDGTELASFYKSNSKWEQGSELPLMNLNSENESKADISIKEIISNDLKELIYIYDFLLLWTIYIKIIEETKILEGQEYPNLFFSHGNVPKLKSNKEL
ncbi:MAG: hypothetical protein VX325_03630 [Bacteroidota bacterium]|nr:hypothetical protein [Bacteroidota bacterium]